MRIALIAPGSRGDVEPYLALAQGLQKAGHAARLVTHANFENLARSHGVDFWPMTGDVQEITQSADMRLRLQSGSFLAILRRMAQEAEAGALALASAGLAACRGMDLLVAGLGGLFVGTALAEKLRLPLLPAYYIPLTATRAYPSFLLPPLPAPLGRIINRPSYFLARQFLWQAFRPADRKARRSLLDLPPAPFFGPYESEWTRLTPILYGYSPAVIPPPPDWGPNIHVTGYWFLEPAGAWAPPPALQDFLAAGSPPVYIGFGSMSSRDPAATTRLILDALQAAGLRAVVQAGWSGIEAAHLPPTVFPIEPAPFEWLFPQMAAVAHHGGAGTTAAGLRAGVPSVVIPFFGDQPFWGRRVAALGAGPAPIPRQKLTAEKLAAALSAAVNDPALRQNAAALGAHIRQEDGVRRAVELIQQAIR